MCDPLTAAVIVSTVASIGSATVSYIGQNNAAAAAKTAANLNYAREVETASAQSNQMSQEESNQAFDTSLAALRAEGDIQAGASAQGLAPRSIAQQVNASMFGLGRNATIEGTNNKLRRNQLGNELTGAEITRQSTIAQTPKGNPLSLVLGVTGALAEGAKGVIKAKKGG